MRLRAGVACCLLLSVMVLLLPIITTAQTDQEITQRIAELEQWILDNPGVFDWHVHNELRHLYSIKNPPDLRKSMEHANVILQHSVMDEYILNILSGWQIGVDSAAARDNLLMNAEAFPDLRFIAAACFLKIGDLYTEEGNIEEAESFYLRVAEDNSPDMAQYRMLAEERGTETTLILNSVGTFNGEAAPEQAGPQTSFAPGEAIRYAASIKNTGSSTVTASLDYLVTGPKEIFSLIEDIAIPPDPPEGGWSLYATSTVPTDAPSGTYTLRVTMTINGQSSTKESSFTVLGGSEQPPAAISRIPEGKAPNLVVLVHGCCTDANGLGEWDGIGRSIKGKLPDSSEWEIVVWDWHEQTPKRDYFNPRNPGLNWFIIDAQRAYDNVSTEGPKLANAIIAAIKQSAVAYGYIHLIGHSTGAKLIHEAVKKIAEDENLKSKQPFIHMTFLDAYTRDDKDSGKSDGKGYGYLENYPKERYFAEHYVDIALPSTDACLANAFNFNISNWLHSPLEGGFLGHAWPINWYKQSITSTSPKFKYGYTISLEGSGKDISKLTNELAQYPSGQQCDLSTLFNGNPDCEREACWE